MSSRTKARAEGLNHFLRDQRVANGITQSAAADWLGHATPQYISNFERGLCEPSLEIASQLCEFYGVSKKELYSQMVRLFQQDLSSKLNLKLSGEEKP